MTKTSRLENKIFQGKVGGMFKYFHQFYSAKVKVIFGKCLSSGNDDDNDVLRNI